MPITSGFGTKLDVCPETTGYGTGIALASTGGQAVLTAAESCRQMFMQASVSNVVNVAVNMGAAATSNCIIIPQAIISGLISASAGQNWFVIPCPSTTVPNFYAASDDESIRCLWIK